MRSNEYIGKLIDAHIENDFGPYFMPNPDEIECYKKFNTVVYTTCKKSNPEWECGSRNCKRHWAMIMQVCAMNKKGLNNG